jgi:hypothetical protein
MFKILVLIFGVLINTIVGGTLACLAGLPPVLGSVLLNVAAAVMPFLLPSSCLFEGVYTEVWTGEMIKKFRDSAESLGWLAKIRSYDQYAEHNVIHFVEIGGDPEVLINGNTYPLGITSLNDADKPVPLDLYESVATAITDNELHAISYDKMASAIERHKEALNEKKYRKAIHALAPQGNGAGTPVVKTSGELSADGSRVMIARKDIIELKRKFDALKTPVQGRVLVLCTDHVNDLLNSDQKFAEQYHNYTTGKISNLYSFEVYEYADCPLYNSATSTKKAFAAAPADNDVQASVAFYAPRMMRAMGQTKSYLSEAKNDTQFHRNLLNFSHYFICLPLKNEAIGAIISAIAPAA